MIFTLETLLNVLNLSLIGVNCNKWAPITKNTAVNVEIITNKFDPDGFVLFVASHSQWWLLIHLEVQQSRNDREWASVRTEYLCDTELSTSGRVWCGHFIIMGYWWGESAVLSTLQCSKVSEENFVERTGLHYSQMCVQGLRGRGGLFLLRGFLFIDTSSLFSFCWCLQPHFISLNSRCSSCLSFMIKSVDTGILLGEDLRPRSC